MAAGSAFTLAPHVVITLEPKYNTVSTQTESMKKEYFEISANAVERYHLEFKVLTTANRDILLNHYKDQSGSYHNFSWQSVPSYINSGSNLTGRWMAGSLQMTVISNFWKCSIIFEVEV